MQLLSSPPAESPPSANEAAHAAVRLPPAESPPTDNLFEYSVVLFCISYNPSN